jgi:phage replication O-like protein O
MIKICNDISDKLITNNFSSYQMRVLLSVLKINHCFHYQIDSYNSMIIQITGLRKSHVSQTLRELKEMHILVQSGNKLIINHKSKEWLLKQNQA